MEHGSKLTAEQLAVNVAGLNFLGWYSEDKKIEAGYTVTSVLTLTAKWEVASSSIMYKSKYGVIPAPVVLTKGAYITATELPAITAEGYEFLGWCKEGSETVIDPGTQTVPDEGIVLVAKWITIYSDAKVEVSLDYWDGQMLELNYEHDPQTEIYTFETFDGDDFIYRWYVNGILQNNSGNKFTLNFYNFCYGTYEIMVIVSYGNDVFEEKTIINYYPNRS